jgi:hypothetical protein
VADAKNGYVPWDSPEALAALISQLGHHAVNWEIAAEKRSLKGDAAVSVARVLKALVAALEAGDDDTLRRFASPAPKYLAERRQAAQHQVDGQLIPGMTSDERWQVNLSVRPWRFDDPRSKRKEDALELRSAMEGWLVRNRRIEGAVAAKTLASHFVSQIATVGRPLGELRAELVEAGVKLQDRATLLEKVASEFEVLLTYGKSDPETFVSRGLIAVGFPEKKASDLFSFENPRSDRPTKPG